MNTRFSTIALVLAGAALALAAPAAPIGPVRPILTGAAQEQPSELVISLSNPARHQKLGLPDFLAPAGDRELTDAAKLMADVLWNDLDFEKEYYLIPRSQSASIPLASPDSLPFGRWTELGADSVVVGSLSRSGAELTVQLNIVGMQGTSRGNQWSRPYTGCRIDNPRFCAHSIADDIHFALRRLDGVARTKLAFTSDRDGGRMIGRPIANAGASKEIYRSDYDGANQMRLTVNRSMNIGPAWAGTGNLLAYTSYITGNADIYIANLAEPGRDLLKPAHGGTNIDNFAAAVSPDGTKVAFFSNRSGNNDIWVANLDGSDLHNVTNYQAANDWAPAWSPDGTRIAFVSDRAGSKQLFVMNANGTNQEVLFTARDIDRPTWSRLGIAFTLGNSSGGWDIGIYDFTKREVKTLTDGIGKNESPAIAPNGRHVAFVTSRWGKEQIAIVDITGQSIRRVTDVGNNKYPNWGPIPPRQ